MTNEVPLLVEYPFAAGHIRYYLAPKISVSAIHYLSSRHSLWVMTRTRTNAVDWYRRRRVKERIACRGLCNESAFLYVHESTYCELGEI
jgi:hypothetical protein